MTPLTTRALETMRRHDMSAAGGRVLVALSGGADSVALLLILREAEGAGALSVAGAAHLHHGLRGAAADGDEQFCRELAAREGVAFVTERVDVASLARAQKRSLEDAARQARYAFLARARVAFDADVVAVAHTADDQAETVLLRLLRGAGTRGLGSIRPRAGPVIRPLLDATRASLREYLKGRGQGWREDASNADVAILRNRIRHELLPALRSRFSPGIDAILARAAALAQQDEDFLQDRAIELAGGIVLTEERLQITLDAEGLGRAPRALSSRIVQRMLERHAGSRPISFEHVDAVLRLDSGQAVSLPGQDAVRSGNVLTVRKRRSGVRSAAVGFRNAFAVSLSIPGEVELASGLAVAAERLETGCGRPTKWEGRGPEVGVAAEAVQLPLGIRTRRPGDRFHPLGAPGSRKLQDFFVDRKVARGERDTVPLVVDARDRIVWVVGQAVAEDFRVTDPSRGVILLKVRHLGGAG